jgi:hypothetical protein
MFNLMNLIEVECKEKYRVKVSNMFMGLEDVDIQVDINNAWGTIRENVRISAKEII